MQTEKKADKTLNGARSADAITLDHWQRFRAAVRGKGYDNDFTLVDKDATQHPLDKFWTVAMFLTASTVVPPSLLQTEGWTNRTEQFRSFFRARWKVLCPCRPDSNMARFPCGHDTEEFTRQFPSPPIPAQLVDSAKAETKRADEVWQLMRLHMRPDSTPETKKPQPAKDAKTSNSSTNGKNATQLAWEQFYQQARGKGHDAALNISHSMYPDFLEKFVSFSAYLLEALLVPRVVERLDGWNTQLGKWRVFLKTPRKTDCRCVSRRQDGNLACNHDMADFKSQNPDPPVSPELAKRVAADRDSTTAMFLLMNQHIDSLDPAKQPAKDEKKQVPAPGLDVDWDHVGSSCAACGHLNPALACDSCPKKFCSIVCKMTRCRNRDPKSKEARYALVNGRSIDEMAKRIHALESSGVLKAVWDKLYATDPKIKATTPADFRLRQGEPTPSAIARWQLHVALKRGFPSVLRGHEAHRIGGVEAIEAVLRDNATNQSDATIYSVFSGEFFSVLCSTVCEIAAKHVNEVKLGKQLMDAVSAERKEFKEASIDAMRVIIRYTFPLIASRCCLCADWCLEECKHCHRRVCRGECYAQHPCIGEQLPLRIRCTSDPSDPVSWTVIDSLRDPLIFEAGRQLVIGGGRGEESNLLVHILKEHCDKYEPPEVFAIMRRIEQLEKEGWFEHRWRKMCTEGKFEQETVTRMHQLGKTYLGAFAAAQFVFAMGSDQNDKPSFLDPEVKQAMMGFPQFWERAIRLDKEVTAGTLCPLCVVEGVHVDFINRCLLGAMDRLSGPALLAVAKAIDAKHHLHGLVRKFTSKLYKKIVVRCGVCKTPGAMHKCPVCKIHMCGKKRCKERHPGVQQCRRKHKQQQEQKQERKQA